RWHRAAWSVAGPSTGQVPRAALNESTPDYERGLSCAAVIAHARSALTDDGYRRLNTAPAAVSPPCTRNLSPVVPSGTSNTTKPRMLCPPAISPSGAPGVSPEVMLSLYWRLTESSRWKPMSEENATCDDPGL